MGDCLRTGEPSWYITNAKVNSAFCAFGIGKSSLKYRPVWLGLWLGTFTCVGWQVIPYGRWRFVALRWVSYEELYNLATFNRTCSVLAVNRGFGERYGKKQRSRRRFADLWGSETHHDIRVLFHHVHAARSHMALPYNVHFPFSSPDRFV